MTDSETPISGVTVLLAEDEASIRETVATMLRGGGFHVVAVVDAASALRHFVGYGDRIDVVLTDYSMPGMDGGEMARRLRGQRPDLPVVYMSAWSRETLVADGRIGAGDPMIQKPFDTDQLNRLVWQVVTGANAGEGPDIGAP